MARIRTVKPEFFRHEGLQDLEIANPGKYPMMVFSGLWVIADREGRFEWRPRRMKLDVLPFLDFDMEETLCLLEQIGLIQRYVHNGEMFGAVTSWERHQIVGRDEPPSDIPAPDGSKTPYFRPLNQTQRFKVYERDNWTCSYCSRDMRNDKRAACLDHVIPYSKGGTNREQNLTTSCKRCNAAKADKTPIEAGFNWPLGVGEYLDKDSNTVRQHYINTPLMGGTDSPDKEGEKEKEEGKGSKPITPIPSGCSPLGSSKSKSIPLSQWLLEVKANGEKAVSDYKPLWAHCQQSGIPTEWVEIAWAKFRDRYTTDEKAKKKKYTDWRRVFLRAVDENWLNLWYWSPKDEQFRLTTVGVTADMTTREAS